MAENVYYFKTLASRLFFVRDLYSGILAQAQVVVIWIIKETQADSVSDLVNFTDLNAFCNQRLSGCHNIVDHERRCWSVTCVRLRCLIQSNSNAGILGELDLCPTVGHIPAWIVFQFELANVKVQTRLEVLNIQFFYDGILADNP